MFVRLNVVGLFNLLGVLTVIEVELPAALPSRSIIPPRNLRDSLTCAHGK